MDIDRIKDCVHKNDLSAFLDKDKRGKGFICPICGNGSGDSGDGLSKIPLSNSYKCFKCGESGDAFFWIGKKFQLDSFIDQVRMAAQIYNIPVDDTPGPSQKASSPNVSEKEPEKDLREYFSRCAASAVRTDYFSKRGLSPEIVSRFGLGYDESFREGTGKFSWKAVIIPSSSDSFEARNIAVLPNSKENAAFKCRKHGKTVIFNGGCFSTEKEKPIFITEGCFDALSIIECGGQAAAIGGVSNTRLLGSLMDRVNPSVPLVLALDNDEAGRIAAKKLADELNAGGVAFIDASAELMGEYHDPNDRLISDRAGLTESIAAISGKAAEVSFPADKQRDEYLRSSVYYSVGEFKDFIERASNLPVLSTGFYSVDKALGGGLYTGLYVLGAMSSLGKTTFALQIADNLAKSGTDVLFFSLEQSKYELMAKSISRESYRICYRNKMDTRYAQSSLSVLNGRIFKETGKEQEYVIDMAFEQYSKYADRLFIYEGVGSISVSEIREKIRDHISFTGNDRPVVFIDYLQILKAADGDERASDKQITDHNITFLKQLSRDFNIPVFAVSSLNRQNYSEKINMAAFKESGAIEYGSDVLMGLQMKGVGDKDFDITAAKEKNPREVELVILKNRSGRVSARGTELNYYPVFNCFRAELEVYEE